jgi:hypothetical protein
MIPESWNEPLAIEFVAAFLIWIVSSLLNLSRGWFDTWHPLRRRWLLIAFAMLVFLLNLIAFSFWDHGIIFFAVTFTAFCWVLWNELQRFWRVGLVGIDRKLKLDRDYARALRLCNNSLDFLGIGASKLVAHQTEFEEAIARCHRSNRPIKFLLSDPDSIELQDAARSAGTGLTDYQQRVRTSLRTLALLKQNRARNIEVRFYSRVPLFRLMFIDDSLCFASHYVLGEGDGSQLPQLNVLRLENARDVHTLYYPLRKYFDDLWDTSDPWDFTSKLDL